MYIVIDGGTTNTRIYTVDKSRVSLYARAEVGAGKNSGLAEFVGSALSELSAAENTPVIASGMITSASGLYDLPHLCAPAGIRELHDGMKKAVIPQIGGREICFIPGVRTDSDMMRGEETELAGLADEFLPDCAYILPGTHSKCVQIDFSGKISEFFTMLTGELLSAVKTGTIAGKSFSFCDTFVPEYLFSGFEFCREYGINEALFRCRTLAVLQGCTEEEVYSFCLGAVLCGETERINKISANKIIFAGKKELREPEALLMRTYYRKEVHCLSEETCKNAVALGAVRIYEFHG